MTTKKQINGLFARLIERNPDLVRLDQFVVLKPLRHVMRSVMIDRTSDADYPQLLWSLGHLFNPGGGYQGICLERFYTAHGAPSYWSEPGMPDAFVAACENKILPLLRGVTTIEELTRFRSREAPEFGSAITWVIFRIHFSAAFGRFDQALRRFERIKHWTHSNWGWRRPEFDHVAGELIPLIRANDRDGVIRLLHAWEEERVKTLGLEAIYERTPFPLEFQHPSDLVQAAAPVP